MFPLNPFDILRATGEATRITAESQVVIGLRLMGLAGFWPMGPAEVGRMMSEKLVAGAQAARAALRTGLSGGTMPEIALAAMKPVGRRTRANARRLTRKALLK